ncbi:pentatricopeptide repeat-containing protein At1g80880, mitochondrial-like [Herrania umbratica]|uniref:Pentatricopeptide repeat-containing protein At1g80880, mitochondrial-like n=1 Tax=Herrania umbratica TaxID=108875 RepID=A0A6J1BJQ0_9ROSI|nr:pentatricopeptide repeat-containing protein At1g80880, mitochondrial-like [Herrania umbratica]
MALLSLARRLQRTHSRILFPFLLHHPAAIPSPASSPSTQQLSFPSSAFHQTLFISSRTLLFTSRFSTLQSLSTQTLNYPFEFTPPPIHGPDSQEQALLRLLKRVAHFSSEAEAVASLDESGIKATQDLVYSVIWTLREEWRLAFLAFKWGEKCGSTDENTYELMVWVLGNHRKFNMAWCLIRDLFRSSMDTRRAMFIMIDR